MAKDQTLAPRGPRRAGFRAPAVTAKPARAVADAPQKKRVGPLQFLREVRAEARKVTWTTWKETWITSVMVGLMVVVMAVLFFAMDAVLHLIIGAILKLASAE